MNSCLIDLSNTNMFRFVAGPRTQLPLNFFLFAVDLARVSTVETAAAGVLNTSTLEFGLLDKLNDIWHWTEGLLTGDGWSFQDHIVRANLLGTVKFYKRLSSLSWSFDDVALSFR